MVSAEEDSIREEIQELQETAIPRRKLMEFIPIYLEDEVLDAVPRRCSSLDFLRASPSGDWFVKFGHFRRDPDDKSGLSHPSPPAPAPAPAPRRQRFWVALFRYGMNWVKDPMNMAILAWLVAVSVGLLVFLLLVIGALDGAIPESSRRKEWEEADNQILNALFTVMCLYQYPRLVHHLVLLLRWQPRGASELRRLYSKGGLPRRHERAHMALVVALLHLTCFSQYALCGLYWGFSRTDRPDGAVNACVAAGIAFPVIAALYTFRGPLGRKVGEETKVSRAEQSRTEQVVGKPEWVGGLFDCSDDGKVACLSLFCTFCVLGWNLERLGFGNMYVHIATFVLLVVSPLWVFGVAALKIDGSGVREAVWVSGVALCALGVLYGGFWRIRMRKRFGLPGNGLCCGRPGVTDCFQWLLCWPCSLSQEVRTGDLYDVEMGSSCRKVSPEGEVEEVVVVGLVPLAGGSGPLLVVPLGRDAPVRSLSCPPKMAAMRTAKVADVATSPPVPPQMQLELDENKRTEEG